MVRVSKLSTPFRKSYQEEWSIQLFKVYRRFRIQGFPLYKIADLHQKAISGNFYQKELQNVEKDEDSLFYIDKILKKRKRGTSNECYVSFLGYDKSFNQWLPCKDVIDVQKLRKER